MQDSYPYEPLAAVMIHVAILAFQGRLSSACQPDVNLSRGTQLTRVENRMPEGERVDQAKFVRVLKIEGKCSCLRAKAAHIPGHLPPQVLGARVAAIADVKGKDLAGLGIHGDPHPLLIRLATNKTPPFIGFGLES